MQQRKMYRLEQMKKLPNGLRVSRKRLGHMQRCPLRERHMPENAQLNRNRINERQKDGWKKIRRGEVEDDSWT